MLALALLGDRGGDGVDQAFGDGLGGVQRPALTGHDRVEAFGGADQPLALGGRCGGEQAGLRAQGLGFAPVDVSQPGGLFHIARGVLRSPGFEGPRLFGDQRRQPLGERDQLVDAALGDQEGSAATSGSAPAS